MTEYFPIPTDMTRPVWRYEPDPTIFGGRRSIRIMPVWEAIERERDKARAVAITWREAAIADGWVLTPTYQHEPAESHGTIQIGTRIGTFKGHVMTRPNKRGENEHDWSLGSGEVTIWGSDGLQIRVPLVYPGIEAIIAATRECFNCGAKDVDTQRYSFAGRCCAKCRPEMQRIHEQPGWCD